MATAKEIFDKIQSKISSNLEKARSINSVYEFKISDSTPDTWTIDLTKDASQVSEGSSGSAKCTVTIKSSDLADIIEKKLNPQMAFMTGKLKVAGDMGMALKLGTIL